MNKRKQPKNYLDIINNIPDSFKDSLKHANDLKNLIPDSVTETIKKNTRDTRNV